MGKRGESSYNPQLGYLKTIFDNDFDFLTHMVSYELRGNTLAITVATYKKKSAIVLIQFISDHAYRFQMYPYENKKVFKNAVIDPPARLIPCVIDSEKEIIVKTDHIKLCIGKYPWNVVTYYDGRLLTKEQKDDSNVDNMCKYLPIGFQYDEEGNIKSVHETMYMYSDEHFFGFGEKFTDFNKRNQLIHCWQRDALCTNSEYSYKNHPFFMSNRGYAIFMNSFTKMKFDMGYTSGVSYQMEVEDAYLDYILFAGHDYKSILKDYLSLFGTIPMIPRWAFGLWMSKCSYRSRKEIEDVITNAEEKNIAIDVIHIDNWQRPDMAGAWVWDEDRFPKPQEMIDNLKSKGVHISLWIYPYISERSEMFNYAQEKGYLIKDESGKAIRFSPMATVDYLVGCFDFTNPEFIAWYTERVKKILLMGVDVVKTDFSEAVPENAVYYDGSNGIQGHNKLTFLYARTIYKIFTEVKKKTGEMPMIWGRSGYAGSHTIPAAWAGDSSSALNNHACILRGGLSLAMCGIPFWGFDMGGFYNTDEEGYECIPEDEEYIRSIEFGFFAPLSRCHGKTPREPWNYSDSVQKIFNYYNEVRHQLIPYLYSEARHCTQQYLPLMRPLLMEFPKDPIAESIDLQYMLGDYLLAAPVFDQDEFKLYLPDGLWADFTTGRIYDGGKYHEQKPSINEIPVFIRENAVIPMQDKDGTTLQIKLFITSRVDYIYYDAENIMIFTACMDNAVLQITTEMEISDYIIITGEKVDKVIINDIATDFTLYGNKILEINR